MQSNFFIDTGVPRSVSGHVISGAFASAIVAGAVNYNRYLKSEISKKEALSNSLKRTIQGGIATGSSIAAANHLGSGNIFGMLTTVSLGAIGVYLVETMSESLINKKETQNNGE